MCRSTGDHDRGCALGGTLPLWKLDAVTNSTFRGNKWTMTMDDLDRVAAAGWVLNNQFTRDTIAAVGTARQHSFFQSLASSCGGD